MAMQMCERVEPTCRGALVHGGEDLVEAAEAGATVSRNVAVELCKSCGRAKLLCRRDRDNEHTVLAATGGGRG